MRINKIELIFLLIFLMGIFNDCDSEGARDWFKNKINKIQNKTHNLFSDNREHLAYNEEYHDEHSHSRHHRPRDNHHKDRYHNDHHNHHHHQHHQQNKNHEHDRRANFNPIVSEVI